MGLRHFVLAAALAGLAACAPARQQPSAIGERAIATATLREWPCPTTEGGLKTFALQLEDGEFGYSSYPEYDGAWLGVHSNGTMPAHNPVHSTPTTQWYLDDDGVLFASGDTVPFAPGVAGAPVVSTLWPSSGPYDGYWQTWVFNTTDYDCQYVPNTCHYEPYNNIHCDSKCSPMSCAIVDAPGDDAPSFPDGLLTCQQFEEKFSLTWAQMEHSDAVAGSWSGDDSGGGAYDTPGEGVVWKVVPSCLLP